MKQVFESPVDSPRDGSSSRGNKGESQIPGRINEQEGEEEDEQEEDEQEEEDEQGETTDKSLP